MTILERIEEKRIGNFRYRAKFILEKLEGNAAPYFSATLDIDELHKTKWVWYSRGSNHNLMAQMFPEMEPFLKWHLFFIGEGPMHYEANAIYWAGFYPEYNTGRSEDPPNVDRLKATILCGVVRGDEQNILNYGASKEALANWLHRRKPLLLEAFNSDMRKLFGKEEYDKAVEKYLTEVN